MEVFICAANVPELGAVGQQKRARVKAYLNSIRSLETEIARQQSLLVTEQSSCAHRFQLEGTIVFVLYTFLDDNTVLLMPASTECRVVCVDCLVGKSIRLCCEYGVFCPACMRSMVEKQKNNCVLDLGNHLGCGIAEFTCKSCNHTFLLYRDD